MPFNLRIRHLLAAGALFAGLTATGCNIFNPSGEGSGELTNPLDEAQVYYNNYEFAKAMEAFKEAIRRDSALSMAYYGYAKAVTKFYSLDKIGILNDLDSTKNDTSESKSRIYFLKPDNATLMDNRLKALTEVLRVMAILEDRDSLTRWYQYTLLDSAAMAAQLDTANADRDTAFATRLAFIQQYLSNADLELLNPQAAKKYRHKSLFPLTDRKKPFESLRLDIVAFKTVHSINRIYDFDHDGDIDFNSRDSMAIKMGFGGAGSLDSLANLAADLETDTTLAQDLNQTLLNAANDLSAASQLLSQLAPSGDSTSSGETQANTDSVIKSLGSSITFYLTGDKIDNDGDGCIDEEILDGKDNDFDGFTDEDSRTIPFTKSDGVDNDLDGRKDPVNPLPPSIFPPGNDTLGTEALVGDSTYPGYGYVLRFVYNYLVATPQGNTTERDLQNPPAQSSWVKIKKGADDMNRRIQIQADSLLARRLPSGRLPDSLGAKLQAAENDLGGCWRNLKTESEP